MAMKRYLLLVAGVTAGWVVALVTIPAFARFVEQLMLLFLSSNA